MKVKKLFTMCLSAVMLFSLLAVPAFAAEFESNAIPVSSTKTENNHGDKNFTFNFDFWDTPIRLVRVKLTQARPILSPIACAMAASMFT